MSQSLTMCLNFFNEPFVGPNKNYHIQHKRLYMLFFKENISRLDLFLDLHLTTSSSYSSPYKMYQVNEHRSTFIP